MKEYRNSLRMTTFFENIFFPKTDEELIQVVEDLLVNNKKYIVIGNSSNTLFKNTTSNLSLISLSKMEPFCIFGNGTVTVSGNFSTIKLAFETQKMGFNNLNFLSGIPGTVGGNIVMNAGCYSYEICNYLTDITVLTSDLQIVTISGSDVSFSYRYSSFQENNAIVLSARIRVGNEQIPDISALNKKRSNVQPIGNRSLGSVFKNTSKYKAWELIDGVGLRGFSIDNTQFSTKHSNFIVCNDGAKPLEYARLIELAVKMVYSKYRIRLSREVIICD